MSATLGAWLRHLEPDFTIGVVERLDRAAAESSDAWNNAGTGHSAFCELNYTPEGEHGHISTVKARAIASSFEVSKQLWASLAAAGALSDPSRFVRAIPHLSFVSGESGVDYLRRRYAALTSSALFQGMRWSTDPGELARWIPLMMDGREGGAPVAATSMPIGTDVNFGALTREMFAWLASSGVDLAMGREVVDLRRVDEGWSVTHRGADGERTVVARFVFLGAGGGALPLLLQSGIPEGEGYGGFPISGQWLVCRAPEVIARHHAKVYGQAASGAPPMSVPHLDTRFIQGRQELLFGPFAGFSTRFLKHGSLLDLPMSVRLGNVVPMLAAGLHNLDLTRYLIEQVVQSPEERLASLRAFVPTARLEDWTLETAGQRVQVIHRDDEEGGVLQFGTEVVASADGSIAALLGASPGASTAASIQLDVLKRCFPERFASDRWQARIRAWVPSHGRSLEDPALLAEVRSRSASILGLGAAG
jgi:malate dehydrogenase (quinone)